MREPGWYWVKWNHLSPWECAKWTSGVWHMNHFEDYLDEGDLWRVGSKIPEPEEV